MYSLNFEILGILVEGCVQLNLGNLGTLVEGSVQLKLMSRILSLFYQVGRAVSLYSAFV